MHNRMLGTRYIIDKKSLKKSSLSSRFFVALYWLHIAELGVLVNINHQQNKNKIKIAKVKHMLFE
jgi:hypothetical protein